MDDIKIETSAEVAKRYWDNYIKNNPVALNHIKKATFAFQFYRFSEHPKAHAYNNGSRYSKCAWCRRSREDVRYDDLDAECAQRPEMKSIADVIREECEKFQKLLDKAEKIVPQVIAKEGLNGKTLFKLKSTHGYDLEVVMGFVDVPEQLRKDYDAEMEREAEYSRSKQKKEIIVAK